MYQPAVERACSTEPDSDDIRQAAYDEISAAINGGTLTILDLAVLLAVPLTSPEKEAREHGTRLLGEVISRCRGVLGEGELHTLAEFLAARLRDWPCVGAAAAACRALLETDETEGAEAGGGGGRLRDDSAVLVLEAAAEVLRSAQSFRQEERSALLALLLGLAAGAGGRWGRLAAARGVPLLDAFLGAADGEKDPRCLLLAFEAVKALCTLHHDPRVDPAPLRQLADEVVDWASSYFPVSFNPPPSLARGPAAITRAQLAQGLEAALASSPFLAGGVLPLLVEKLSSTYRPAKEDALSALRRCCPRFGPEALAQHAGQLWPALRGEILTPGPGGGSGGAPGGAPGAPGPGGGGGEGGGVQGDLSAAAACCLTVVVRAAGPGVVDALALQDSCVSDLLSVVRSAAGTSPQGPTHGSSSSSTPQRSLAAAARADRQVLAGATVLAAICAAGPAFLQRVHGAVLAELQTLLYASLTSPSSSSPSGVILYGSPDQTLYCITILAAVIDAVAADMSSTAATPPAAAAASTTTWFGPGSAAGLAALAEVKQALVQALNAVHARLIPAGGISSSSSGAADVVMAAEAEVAEAWAGAGAGATGVGPDAAAAPAGGYDSPAATGELWLALTGAWQALLRLHAAAAAAATAAAAAGAGAGAALALSASELAAAGGHLCDCALSAAAAASGGGACGRLQSGGHRPQRGELAAEAEAGLRLLLQLQPLTPPPPPPTTTTVTTVAALGGGGSSSGSGGGGGGGVVSLVIAKLVSAMAPPAVATAAAEVSGAAAAAAAAESGEEGSGGSRRAAALGLAMQLATGEAAAGGQGGGGGGSALFAAALLGALGPVVLGLKGMAEEDEAWLLDCLRQLTSAALPPLAWRAPAATSSTTPSITTTTTTAPAPTGTPAPADSPADSVASAAHQLVSGALAAAAEWEAAGVSGLPFAGTGGGACAGGGGGSGVMRPGGALAEAWCGAVQELVACCDGKQQLDVALEAAECVSALAAAAPPATVATGDGDDLPSGYPSPPHHPARLPLACAALTGLRPPVLAANSTAVLADALLRLFPLPTPAAAGAGTAAASGLPPHVLCTAAVALAAVVNRWQDAAGLDAWLEGSFRPALLRPLQRGAPPPDTIEAGSAVMAVGWMGRALALRNHPALQEVVEALLACLFGGGGGGGGAAAGGEEMMDVDGAAAAAAAARAGCDSAPALALQAAEAFGVLVADAPVCGGVSLPARPAAAVCRVLWQQRTFSLCVQALVNSAHSAHATRPQGQLAAGGPADPGPAAVAVAVAVARLAAASPKPLCRQDAARLAPLLFRSARTLSRTLTGAGTGTASAPAPATSLEAGAAGACAGAAAVAVMAAALRGVLGVLLDWLQQQKTQPAPQLGQALQDHVSELVECCCEAAAVGAGPAAAAAAAALPAGVAAAVREEALRCCTALMDAVPYHLLHPLRSQVLACVMRALDDNRRSVRQLAVRARRVWSDK